MKKCPNCAREIEDNAVRCGHCGELLTKEEKIKWYFTIPSLVAAFVCFGPFALPLVWFNPRFSRRSKIAIAVIVGIVTCFVIVLLIESMKHIVDYYRRIYELL